MPQFRILTHDHPFRHWDLLLEFEGVLRTWRLLTEPTNSAGTGAEQLNDHRIEYLTYEGPVSGGRGSVSEWDAGRLEWLDDNPRLSTIRLQLYGAKLRGHWRLIGPAPSKTSPADGRMWRFEPADERVADIQDSPSL